MQDFNLTPEDFDVTTCGADIPPDEARADWQRIERALAERPVDREGLARLAGALADRLDSTGDCTELAAAHHLAVSIGQVSGIAKVDGKAMDGDLTCHPFSLC